MEPVERGKREDAETRLEGTSSRPFTLARASSHRLSILITYEQNCKLRTRAK